MSKSYKEQRHNKDSFNADERPKNLHKRTKSRNDKFIHNALRSKNLIDLIKYSEEE